MSKKEGDKLVMGWILGIRKSLGLVFVIEILTDNIYLINLGGVWLFVLLKS